MPAPSLYTVLTELAGVVGAALPELLAANGGGGIRAEQYAERIPWEKLKPPCGVVTSDIWPTGNPEEWGLSNLTHLGTVYLWVTVAGTGDSQVLYAKLQALERYFRAHRVGADYAVQEWLGIQDDPMLEPNRRFLAANMSAMAGFTSLSVLTAETLAESLA